MSEIRRSDSKQTTGTTSSGDSTVKETGDVEKLAALSELAVERDHGRADRFVSAPGAQNWVEVAATEGGTPIGTDDLAAPMSEAAKGALASNADAGFQTQALEAEVEPEHPKVAAELNKCADHLNQTADAIKRGKPGDAVAHSGRAVDCALSADERAPAELKGKTSEIVELVEHADRELKTKIREGAKEVLTDVEKLAKLSEGDALEIELAGGLDVGGAKGGVRTKASITVIKGADGALAYQAHVEALLEGELERGRKGSGLAATGALGVGMDLQASSPEEAARLVGQALGIVDGSDVLALVDGDTSALGDLRGHVTAVSYFGEIGGKAGAEVPVLELAKGRTIALEGSLKAMQIDTFHLDKDGHVTRAQRDRVVELAGAGNDKRTLGTDAANVAMGIQLGQPKATLTISRTWDTGDDGYDIKDMAKMGVEQFTMGTFSADADTESVSIAAPTGAGETTTASMTTTDPGVIEDAVEVLFTDATAGGKAAELLDQKSLEATTTKHRDAKVGVFGKGLVVYAEASFAVHDEQSKTTSKTTFRELFNRITGS